MSLLYKGIETLSKSVFCLKDREEIEEKTYCLYL